jgi:hypothetical protein
MPSDHMDQISDDDLEIVRKMVEEQRAVPAVIVGAILNRLLAAEQQQAVPSS